MTESSSSEQGSAEDVGAVGHLQIAIDHIEKADNELEQQAGGDTYEGEDAMVAAMLNLKRLTEKRLEVKNAE